MLRPDGRSLTAVRTLHHNQDVTRSTLWFLLLFLISILVFFRALETLVGLLGQKGEYSHILLIPAIGSILIYRERTKISIANRPNFWIGVPLVVLSLVFWIAGNYVGSLSQNDNLSLSMFALVLYWIGSFIICYGTSSARIVLFVLPFLLLMVPFPDFLIGRIVAGLQKVSADTAYLLFTMAGVPVFRNGFIFSLPGIEIEIATECSGIRSSIALFITSLVLGHYCLASNWKKLVLMLFVLPIVVLKNGLRIFTLAVLGIYVNPSFLNGPLHHRGGIVFYALSVLLLLALLKMLREPGTSTGTKGRLSLFAFNTPRSLH